MITKLIILAAGKGTRLRPVTNKIPKCLTPLGSKTILEHQVDTARNAGIKDIVVVGGYRINQITLENIKLIENNKFDSTNMVESLKCASHEFEGGFVLSYADIVYQEDILLKMMNSNESIAVACDMDWENYWKERFENPLIDAERFRFDKNKIIEIGGKAKSLDEIESQYIGLLSFSIHGVNILNEWFSDRYKNENMFITDMITDLINCRKSVTAVRINKGWLEIDDLHDLEVAKKYISQTSRGSVKVLR